ncbi:hypothetical protein UFOVP257_117 [uncultured Caudovirales phage]|uniref:Major tropism determinant N-terminal domain-containing protein n=1 Tax=uncultured Caudovirales phage TaxID=2100421 RepID=A0A6J5LF23_9CAUD|nr:hypothetical protein UFOVP257_117 [uncultured Caudovirales phage]
MTINYSKQVLLKRGNTAVSSAYIGPVGEVTVDTDLATIRVHDGVTPGGHLSTSSASGATPPADPRESGLWYDTVGGRLYVYYAGAWVDASPAGDQELNANVANLSAQVTGLTSDVANVEAHITSLDANIGTFETTVTGTVNTINANINTLNETIIGFEGNAGPTSAAWTSDNPPMITNVGALWYDDVSGRLYVRYDDTWVDANPPITTGFGNVLPSANVTYSLGSEEYQWKDLWVSNNTIYIGNTPLSVQDGTLLVNGNVVSGGSGDRLVSGEYNVVLDNDGTLTIPGSIQFPVTFTAVFDEAHFHNGTSAFRGLTDAEWSTDVTFNLVNGQIETHVTPIDATNPGYVPMDWFGFSEEDHGIPGYNFSINIMEIYGTVPALAVSPAPTYIPSIKSDNAISIQSGTNVWQFGDDGLTLPAGSFINGLTTIGSEGTNVQTDLDTNNVYIRTYNQISYQSNQWQFGTDGNLTFPNGDLTIGSDVFGDPAILAAPGKNISIVASGVGDGYEVGSSIGWVDSITEPTKIAAVTANNPLYVGAGDVGILTGDYLYTGTTNVWNFGADGNLTLPAGGNLVTSTGSLHTISLNLLKSIVASSGSWEEFQANIASL